MSFKALLATKAGDAISAGVVDFDEKDLMPGDVTVAVEYSTVNYKDGMALTGFAPIIQAFPLIAGVDFSGVGHRLIRASNPETALSPTAGVSARPIMVVMPRRHD